MKKLMKRSNIYIKKTLYNEKSINASAFHYARRNSDREKERESICKNQLWMNRMMDYSAVADPSS